MALACGVGGVAALGMSGPERGSSPVGASSRAGHTPGPPRVAEGDRADGHDVSRGDVRPDLTSKPPADKPDPMPATGQRLDGAVTSTAPPPSPREIAQALLSTYGWDSTQYSCLDRLWIHESNWDPEATNPITGAFGIPQALPPEKMAEYGADWRTSPRTQIEWGLAYIDASYGTPCSAWDFWLSHDYY